MHTSSRSLPEDPGFVVLDVLLRFLGVTPDAEQLRRWDALRPLKVSDLLSCLREFDLAVRQRRLSWRRLAKSPLPGIAVLRDGGLLLLGQVKDSEAIVLTPGATRATLVTRTNFEAMWDGQLILVQSRRPIVARFRRIARAFLAQAQRLLNQSQSKIRPHFRPEAAREAVQAAASAGGTSIVVFADHARKLGRAVAKLSPDAGQRSDEIAFLPAALEIVETPPSPLGRAVAFTILGIFAAVLLWAVLGTVDIVAVASGKVVPSSRTKTVQPYETGVVSKIHVHDGQTVKSGDLLIELDPTMNVAELRRLKGDLQASRLDIARLKAAVAKGDQLAAFTAPDDAPTALVEMHRRLLASQISEQTAKLTAIDRQLKQKEAERTTFRFTIDKLKATLKPLQQRVEIREQLVEKQLVSKITYLAELQELVAQQHEILVQESKYNEADAVVSALIETRTRTIAEHERAILEELSKAEQKASSLAQEVIRAEQRTSYQRLVAPIDGTVQQLAVHTIGGVVTPAQALLMVVPTENQLEVEAMISNRDIGFVEAGQDVEIKIDTFSFTRYGTLRGTILSISQDAIPRNKSNDKGADPRAGAEGASSEPRGQELLYSARISVDRLYMEVENKRVSLSPGMAVTAEVKTGKRRIVSYLLSPLLRYKQESLRER